jgi:hypothetical protein
MAVNTALIRVSGVIAAYRQQPADQLGTLSQKAYFGRSFGFVPQFRFDRFQHLRQRNRVWYQGPVQIGGDQFWSL